ncbi:hypothetical protein [Acidocella aminolytica]|uniref:Uncharacterized protein n=1 Tax=Acidocella aminolytica 101 = DSM 11237 TaxID=1120923 RepID=A0A0D6PJT9_9PROT|nr:hypothetical protein [Acidocella aminolytica]GAN81468.1 hypothetical protein Aam_096_027 [Acidocella aminolytica 101 = DSM 11237]GBQ35025.1 hypothetical protein AA11237_0881 [Acidocella aminolytica 101 = DSM 11237]SHF02271.1 hypothetical protein SAMN02746095_01880 [Acidocella aminolytica 101 = DSM 11237]
MALIRKQKPEATPARQALATALAEYRELLGQIEAQNNAEAAAQRQIETYRNAMYEAQGRLDQAQEDAAEYMLAQATGRAMERPVTAPQARADLEAAKSNMEAAKAAEAELKRQGAHLPQSLQWRKEKLTKAAAAVVADLPEPVRLVERFQQLQREILETGHAIMWLSSVGALDMGRVEVQGEYGKMLEFSAAEKAINALTQTPGQWKVEQTDRGADFERLAIFYDALQRDPDAVFQG